MFFFVLVVIFNTLYFYHYLLSNILLEVSGCFSIIIMILSYVAAFVLKIYLPIYQT